MELHGPRSLGQRGRSLSRVEILILAQLRRKPAHGYAILSGLEEQLGGWKIKSGTLYPALRRLVHRGLIKGKKVLQEERPDAIEYQLTAKGQKILTHVLQTLGNEMHKQDSFWFFLSDSTRGETTQILFDQVMENRSPTGFAYMKRSCSPTCSGKNLKFLKQYKEHLLEELDWVNKHLAELKDDTPSKEVKKE
ncbi:MAG: PadR family transcriptional regulator [Candidatus Thorarchaeota archaeon]